MKIPYKTKLISVITFTILAFISGCVDTNDQMISPSIEFYSQYKVVNLVSGVGAATLTMNGQSLGTVDYASEYPVTEAEFTTILSGSKTLQASYASGTPKSYQFGLATDYKYRIFLIGNNSSSEAVTVAQRYIWQTKNSKEGSPLFPDTAGQVSFFNGSPDAIINAIEFKNESVDTKIEFETPLEMGDNSGYIFQKPGAYTINVMYNDTTMTFNYTLGAKSRYTAVIYDNAVSLKNKVFVDD